MNVGIAFELLRTVITVFYILGKVKVYGDSLNEIVYCLNH